MDGRMKDRKKGRMEERKEGRGETDKHLNINVELKREKRDRRK